MVFFRRVVVSLALALPALATVAAQAPDTSSSSSSTQAQAPAAQTQGQATVQARIRMRRDQRRATAIHDAYDHRWETYLDMGYLRFTPGPSRQRVTDYAWESGLTRFSNERLGWTLDGRGYYGTAYVGLNFTNITRPAISQYDIMAGPTYRFYLKPKWDVAGRVLGGMAYGNFTGDTSGFGTICPPGGTCLLYPTGYTYAASASVIGEYNISPSVAFKLAPEYFFTGFGSSLQASRGFTIGFTYRFGKQ